MKKIILLFLLITLFCLPTFSFSLTDIASGEFKQFDIPLMDGIAYFQSAAGAFLNIAIKLASVIGLIGVLWNAFRLWFGTQEVKKAAIDIGSKILLYTVLLNMYPYLVNGVIDTAINIGMKAGGGYNDVNKAFYELREDAERKVDIAQQKFTAIFAGTEGTALSVAELENLAKRTNKSIDELESFLAERGVTVYSREEYKALGNSEWYQRFFKTDEQKELKQREKEFLETYDKVAAKELGKDKDLQQAMVTLNAINEVLTKTVKTTSATDSSGVTTESQIETYFYSPFMKDSKGAQTNLLSPGAMIKTGVLISDIISRMGGVVYDQSTGKFTPRELSKGFWDSILSFIMNLIMTLGLVFACIFCVIQYVMCIFEYFIVTSVGIIFIPFILWDGTKSFAAKLITLFTSFFIKIMVMTLCLFWVYASFIKLGITIIATNEPVGWLSFANFIFTCLLGWAVTQNGPQIALTILNGSPQLSMGEFLHAAGTAMAGAAMAKKATVTTATVLKTTHKGLQSAARGIETEAAIWKGSGLAAREAHLSGGQKFATQAGSLVRSWGTELKDSSSAFMTGNEKKGNKDYGYSHVGGGYAPNHENKNGSQNFNDAVKGASKATKARLDKKNDADKASKQPADIGTDRPTGIDQTRE